MRTDGIGRKFPQKTMWWKVDLGGMYNIYSIQIMFKNYDKFGRLIFLLTFKKVYTNVLKNNPKNVFQSIF